jgi:hypothetical protein
MSFEAERKALEAYFKQNWSDNTVPLIFDNSRQKKPTDTYLTFTLVYSDGKQAELGAKGSAVLMRYDGLLQIDVLAPQETGTAKANQIADTASNILRRQQITDDAGGVITFGVPNKRNFGITSNTDRFRIVLSVPYRRDIKQ